MDDTVGTTFSFANDQDKARAEGLVERVSAFGRRLRRELRTGRRPAPSREKS
jgi:hypothetical protein